MQKTYLTSPQLKAELEKCLQCTTKPCKAACPVKCSPCDFIKYAKDGDFNKAAEEISRQNPLGEVCGLICPDKFCVKACLRQHTDAPIKIPAVQAAIMQKANIAQVTEESCNRKKIAVIGLGPAGIGAVAEALKQGYIVDAFEKETEIGGALNLIPSWRLPRKVLEHEWQKISNNSRLNIQLGVEISNYEDLAKQNYDAVIAAVGLQKSQSLNISGEEFAIDYTKYLSTPQQYTDCKHIMIIGGGAAAADCALTAVKQNALHTEMLVRRKISNMKISTAALENLLQNGVDITAMTRPLKIEKINNKLVVHTVMTEFDENGKLKDIASCALKRTNIDLVVKALGSVRLQEPLHNDKIIYAGDFLNGGSSAVEALSGGIKAVQSLVD